MIWFVQGSSVQQVLASGQPIAGLSFDCRTLSDDEIAQSIAKEYIRRHNLSAVVEYGVVGSTGVQYPTYSVVSTDPMFGQPILCRFVITEDRNPPVGVVDGLSAPPTVRPDLQSPVVPN